MISRTIKMYKCEHCGYIEYNKTSMLSHEEKCYFNPFNRHCMTCQHAYSECDWNGCERICCYIHTKLSEPYEKFCNGDNYQYGDEKTRQHMAFEFKPNSLMFDRFFK